MKLHGTQTMERLVPILAEAMIADGRNRPAVRLLRTLCAMAETDDYEEILRLQGAARFLAASDEGISGNHAG